jgi:Zn-finger nucleic acid-binding protein
MQCPKCQSAMEKVPTAGGVADRCSSCQGMWFDLGEHEDMLPYADIVDRGDAAAGAEFNAIDRIRCPVCPDSPMLRMVDAQQPHIWFESCPVCFGRFFDAGEFRDLSERTLADVFRRLASPARD